MQIMCLIYGACCGFSSRLYKYSLVYVHIFEGRLISPWPEIEAIRTLDIIGVSTTIQRNKDFCPFVVYQDLIFEVIY